jgi:hypothetical protein
LTSGEATICKSVLRNAHLVSVVADDKPTSGE